MDWDWNAILEASRVNTILEAAHGISTLHWIAAACIATGATLLVTSVVLQLRRRIALGRAAASPSSTEPTTAPTPVVIPTDVGYAVASSAPGPSPDLQDWADRLAIAADRLAALRTEMLMGRDVADGTILKETPSHVEYVFRTGEA